MEKILNYAIEKDGECNVIFILSPYLRDPITLHIEPLDIKYDGYILEIEDYEDYENLGFFKTQESAIMYFQEYVKRPGFCKYKYNEINGFNLQ